MFWDNFVQLCNKVKKSPSAVAAEVGVKSRGTTSNWKRGAVPHGPVLLRIAEYFGVAVDDLLSDDIEKATLKNESGKDAAIEQAISMLAELAALGLTEDELRRLLDFGRGLVAARKM